MDADVSRAQVHGKLHTLDENAISGALEPMFGTCNKKQDLQFEADGFDVQISSRTRCSCSALQSITRHLEDDKGMWERFEWSPT